MSNEGKILIGIGVLTLVIVIGAAFLFGGKPGPTQATPKLTEDQVKLLIREDSHVKKPTSGNVILVEFGDFQCPACAAYYPIVESLLDEYKGKLGFAFRNFPLQIHKNANLAAEAAEAAGAQGKFFEMYSSLYQNQKEWGESNKAMEYMEKYAANIGLDVEQFKSDVNSKKHEAKIKSDTNDGLALGVNSTPTFYMNGEKLDPGLRIDDFRKKINEALNPSQ